MGKQRVDTDSREAERFRWLIGQLTRDGMSQSEIARRMAAAAPPGASIHQSYVNKLFSGQRKGIGAGIVRMVKDGLGIHPDYFYDDYDKERDHKLYKLEEKRIEKKVQRLEVRDVERDKKDADRDREIAELKAVVSELKGLLAARAEESKVKKFPPRG